jgi:hypothetical protein
MEDRYLGDGVYASFDGYHVILDLRAQFPPQKIALDPSVRVAVSAYFADLDREFAAAEEGEDS